MLGYHLALKRYILEVPVGHQLRYSGVGAHQLKLKCSVELSEKAVRTFISVGADWFEQLLLKELI